MQQVPKPGTLRLALRLWVQWSIRCSGLDAGFYPQPDLGSGSSSTSCMSAEGVYLNTLVIHLQQPPVVHITWNR
jgi:hypothetical protein